jgi:hypothetical protein
MVRANGLKIILKSRPHFKWGQELGKLIKYLNREFNHIIYLSKNIKNEIAYLQFLFG